jgi:mannose-6-phosphate isomerase-like protein (cupin superfamily)
VHTYISLGANSSTYGRHNDDKHVLLVQSIGEMQYGFDDGVIVTLVPGDSLLIKKGVYHTPIVPGPRVTLSAAVSKF